MYKVLAYFTDLQDNGRPYNEGDIFPRDGLTVTEARLDELSSTRNRRKIKLIELVEDKVEQKYTKTEINRMSTAQLRELAVENGIEQVEEITGAELKKLLISRFEL